MREKCIMRTTVFQLTTVFILLQFCGRCGSSVGDRSPVFETCMNKCTLSNCSSTNIDEFLRQRPSSLAVMQWDCSDECQYQCMWTTVDWFNENGRNIPQFYGKWPFLRMFGVQEPASALFSVLNGIVHFHQWRRFSNSVPHSSPMYVVHTGYCLVCINAWVWSTVFHSRDVYFTEMMDYFCALMGVIYSSYLLFVRWCGTTPLWKPLSIAAACTAFYLNHIYYLAFVRFDYSYNMKVAVGVGLFNVFGWIVWCVRHYSTQPYVWKCAATVILVNVLLALEVGDFPPLWFVLDAHSLWHLGTIPIPILWYSFVIEDCLFLYKEKKQKDS